jgi:membrane-bound inhibitor of C-type lysozyme
MFMNTMMKLTATLPAVALLAACSTTTPTAPTTPATPTNGKSDMAYDRMAPAPYTCTDDSQILAKQSINKNQATISATVPKLNWSQQEVILVGGVNGDTASYVNDSNPDIIYAWHMKGDEAILATKWANGKEYQVNCKMGR